MGDIHMIRYILRKNIHRAMVLLMGVWLCLFVVDMHTFVLMKDNVHIGSSKSIDLDCGYEMLVALNLFNIIETLGLTLHKVNNWRDMERPLVSMITCIIREKHWCLGKH